MHASSAARKWVLGIALGALAAMPSLAWAGGQQAGVLDGLVVDTKAKPVAGATITLISEQLISGMIEKKTDERGRFRFVDLAPGTYDVVADHAQHGSGSELGLKISIGDRRALTLVVQQMQNGYAQLDQSQEVIVVAQAAGGKSLDTGRAAVSTTVGRDTFDPLPGTRRGFEDILLLTPGSAAHRVPSQETGRPTLRGGSWLDNQVLIDGLGYADPLTSSILSRFDFFALEEVEVMSGAFEAEYGQAMGGVINMTTRSGGSKNELGARVVATPGGLSPGKDPVTRYEANARSGGPIIKDRLWYFGSVSYAYDAFPIVSPAGVKQPENVIIHSPIGFGKLSWEPNANHKVQLHVSGSWSDQLNYAPLLADERAQNDYRIGGVTGQVQWKWFGDSGFLTTSLGVYARNARTLPASGDVNTPAQRNLLTGVQSQNGSELQNYESQRVVLQAVYTRFFDFLGSHELKVGAELAPSWIRFRQATPGNEILDNNGDLCLPEQGMIDACNLSRQTGAAGPDGMLVPGVFESRATAFQFGGFVQDSWKVGYGLRVNPGWRADRNQIKSNGQTLATFNGWSGPRFGLVYDVLEKGSTIVRASYGRFQQTGVLALPLFFGPNFRTDYYRFNQATRQFDTFDHTSGGNTGNVVDPSKSENVPTSTELTFSVEQSIVDSVSVRAGVVYRRFENLYGSTETNLVWNDTGSNVVGFRDGTASPHYTLTTSPDFFREYIGGELEVRGKIGKHGAVLASYTLSRLRGTSDLDELTDTSNVGPTVLANQRQHSLWYGPLWADHTHVGKIAAGYSWPELGLSLGTTINVVSGGPYSRLYYNANLGGFVDRRAPRGVDPGSLNDPTDDKEVRLPVLIDWGVRGAMNLERFLDGQKLSVEAQVLNVLNRTVATQIAEADRPAGTPGAFGQVLQRQPALAITVGVSYTY